MSGTKTEEHEWTKANLQKLLAALKTSIPEHDRTTSYLKGLKTVDWKAVAFPPFSPEACQKKVAQILHKMRKFRSLTELVVEAEDVISNPVQINKRFVSQPPKRPSPPNVMFCEENCADYQKKHPSMSQEKLFKHLTKEYQALPNEEKAQYVQKFEVAAEDYLRRLHAFSKEYQRSKPEHKTNQKRLSADASDGYEDEEDRLPKPPRSGYQIFCREQRVPTNVSAQKWQDMTQTQRDEYNTLFKELKRLYLVKLGNYLGTCNEKKQDKIQNKRSMARFRSIKSTIRKGQTKFPGEPKMPSKCGNVYFIRDQVELLKEKFPLPKERLRTASQMWNLLSNREKERYKKEACERTRKYWIELQNWFKKLPADEQEAYRKCYPTKSEYLDDSSDAVFRPSDSEDEDIEDSSSDEEENDSDRCEVEEEEEDNDAVMFELY